MKKIKYFLYVSLFCILGCGDLLAATTPNSAITPQFPQSEYQNFVQGTDAAGTYKTIYTAGTAGSIVKGIIITTNDASVAHLMTCQLYNGATGYTLGAVNLPISSGYTAAAFPVNFIAPSNIPGLPVDNNGNPFIYLAIGSSIRCTFATNLTSSDLINITALGSDF